MHWIITIISIIVSERRLNKTNEGIIQNNDGEFEHFWTKNQTDYFSKCVQPRDYCSFWRKKNIQQTTKLEGITKTVIPCNLPAPQIHQVLQLVQTSATHFDSNRWNTPRFSCRSLRANTNWQPVQSKGQKQSGSSRNMDHKNMNFLYDPTRLHGIKSNQLIDQCTIYHGHRLRNVLPVCTQKVETLSLCKSSLETFVHDKSFEFICSNSFSLLGGFYSPAVLWASLTSSLCNHFYLSL